MEQFVKPILFIVFKRFDATRKVFEQIKRIKPLKLYIASDGPNNITDKEKVLQVRNFIINNINWDCDVKTKFRENNMGLGLGVHDAISWFFSEEDCGIILEDDCLPSISFFNFCNDLLDYYRDNKRIGVIQGFNPFRKDKNYPYSYFFSKYDLKWGWATWRDRWQYQDIYTKDWPQLKRTDFLLDVFKEDKLVRHYWENIFDFIHNNPHVTWDIQFTFKMMQRGMLAVVPTRNLILNIGYTSDATTTKWGVPKHIKELELHELEFPLFHTLEISTDNEYDKAIEKIHFEINLFTVLRLEIRNILESNIILNKTILPFLVNFYRLYKKIKSIG